MPNAADMVKDAVYKHFGNLLEKQRRLDGNEIFRGQKLRSELSPPLTAEAITDALEAMEQAGEVVLGWTKDSPPPDVKLTTAGRGRVS